MNVDFKKLRWRFHHLTTSKVWHRSRCLGITSSGKSYMVSPTGVSTEHKRLCNRNSYTLASRWRRPGRSAHASILQTATFAIFSWTGVKASWLHVSKLGLSKDRFNMIFLTTRVQPCYTCPPPNGRFGYCLSGLWDESQLKFATFILNFNTKYRVMALHMKRKQGYPRSSNTSQAESHSS